MAEEFVPIVGVVTREHEGTPKTGLATVRRAQANRPRFA